LKKKRRNWIKKKNLKFSQKQKFEKALLGLKGQLTIKCCRRREKASEYHRK
jgi:hypothetical protein